MRVGPIPLLLASCRGRLGTPGVVTPGTLAGKRSDPRAQRRRVRGPWWSHQCHLRRGAEAIEEFTSSDVVCWRREVQLRCVFPMGKQQLRASNLPLTKPIGQRVL